jgi:hypothetical protein
MNDHNRFHQAIASAFARGFITAKQLETLAAIYKNQKR